MADWVLMDCTCCKQEGVAWGLTGTMHPGGAHDVPVRCGPCKRSCTNSTRCRIINS